MNKITIAIAQYASIKGDVEANVRHHGQYIRAAGDNGARFILFPELSLTGYEPELAAELAVSIGDERFHPLIDLAIAHDMIIVAGAPVLTHDGTIQIGLLSFLPDETIRLHTKQYLHPGEEKYFVPGDRKSMLALSSERIALAVCADITHPDHSRSAAEHGATIYAASVLITENGYTDDTRLLRR